MKNPDSSNRMAFSVVELMVVVAIAVLLALLLQLAASQRKHSARLKCVNHLKQSALGFKIFASDGGDRYPYQVVPAMTNATAHATIGLTNANLAGPASPMFTGQSEQAARGLLSNELGAPTILQCPGNAAKRRNVAVDWSVKNRFGFFSEQGPMRMGMSFSRHLDDEPE